MTANGRMRVRAFRFVQIACVTAICCLYVPAARSEAWLGWRGGSAQNAVKSSSAPGVWSSTNNVLWRVAIPGEGHSSPVVTSNRVYLTTAYATERSILLRSSMRAALVIAFAVTLAAWGLLLNVGDIWAQPPTGRGLKLRAEQCCLLVAAGASILVGDDLLSLGRCPIRGWLASSMTATVLMSVARCSMGSCGKARWWLAGTCVMLAMTIPVMMPCRDHAFSAGLFSSKAMVVYLCALCPVLVAMQSVRGSSPTRDRDVLEPLSNLAAFRKALAVSTRRLLRRTLAAMVAVVGMALAVSRFSGGSASQFGGAPPSTRLAWCVASAALVWTLAAYWFLWTRGPSRGLSALLIVGMGLAMALSLAAVGLESIGRSVYLNYHWGAPRVRMSVSIPVLCCALVLLVTIMLLWASRMRGMAVVCSFDRMVVFGALVTAALCMWCKNAPSSQFGVTRGVVAFNRTSGAIEWTSAIMTMPPQPSHRLNTPATPTIASDGNLLFAYFGNAGAACLDQSGSVLWINRFVPFQSVYGVAASPVFCDGVVVFSVETPSAPYLCGLDARDGRCLWRTSFTAYSNLSGSSRTPLVLETSGTREIFIWRVDRMIGIVPRTGATIWEVPYVFTAGDMVAGAVTDGNAVYLSEPGRLSCWQLTELRSGRSLPRWNLERSGLPNVSTPVLILNYLFGVSDNGNLTCVDRQTGRLFWEGKARGQFFSSPVCVGDRVFLTNTRGETTVFRVADNVERLSVNSLGEACFANFSPVDGGFYVRTSGHLWRLQDPEDLSSNTLTVGSHGKSASVWRGSRLP